MDFSSLSFIFYFLPIALAVYYLSPMKWRKLILILESLLFYGIALPFSALYLVGVLILNFIGVSFYKQTGKKVIFGGWISFDILCLIYFKISGHKMAGISFFTFTILAFWIDVYREKIKNFHLWDYMLSITFFPKLLSGPIATYQEMKMETVKLKRNEKISKLIMVEQGLGVFIIGLFYKVVLADHLAGLWNQIQTIGFESISTPLAWMGAIGYSLQIYFDFHGYTLMAIGIGKMFGFTLPENFNFPYSSKSVSEFYRRWHMTLGRWFKEYVYIPLGGNRCGKLRLALHLGIVWVLTGLWHGIGWHFLFWGIYLFLFICLEKFLLKPYLDKSNVISHLYLALVISISWLIFAIPKITDLVTYLSRMFPFLPASKAIAVNALDYLIYARTYGFFIVLAFLFSLPLPENWIKKYMHKIGVILALLILFWYCIYEIVMGMNNPFLYFQF